MTQIDKSKPVMITGATGFVAGWIVKKLLDEGITVHAAVRNPENEKKVGHLKEIASKAAGEIKFFKSDLLVEGSYAQAMEGCELVFHTASPFISNFKDPQKELVDPAVKGTRNVLETANKTNSVKRVVLTSSAVAMYCDASDIEGRVLSEKDWNTNASLDYQPYSYSKVEAEKAAWEMAEAQDQWDLVAVNPTFVLGPSLTPNLITSETFNILKQMGDGTLKSGAPKLPFGMVDVRDLADIHFAAGYNAEAKGRYLSTAHDTSLLGLALSLAPTYGKDYPLPKGAIPKWLLLAFGPMINKSLNRRYIRNNVNKEIKSDNSKSRRELGASYRPMQETMNDSFQFMIDHKLI
ncbi:MAG: NAD-dependent epimerase/dehydratase family protein [Bacteroidota bacterium]